MEARAEQLRRLDLELLGLTMLQPAPCGERRGERGRDDRRVVAEDVGKVALPEVEDLVTVRITDICAVGALDAHREWPVETHAVAAAVDHDTVGPAIELCGAREAFNVGGGQGVDQLPIVTFHVGLHSVMRLAVGPVRSGSRSTMSAPLAAAPRERACRATPEGAAPQQPVARANTRRKFLPRSAAMSESP